MENSKLANRYAKALFQVSVDENILQTVYEDMLKLEKLLNESHDLKAMLKSPIIKTKTKLVLIEKIFRGSLNDVIVNFLNIITKAKREKFTQTITYHFIQIYKDFKGIKSAKITTVIELDDVTKNQIINKLKEFTNSEIELSQEIDKNLIGGMQLFFDNKKYDNSLRTKLNKLRIELIEN